MADEWWGKIYLKRMDDGKDNHHHPKNDKVWARNEELMALATFLNTPIVSGVYHENGAINWCCFTPITRGLNKGHDMSYKTSRAIYILNTAVSTLTPGKQEKANHFRVLKGLQMVSPIPGLDPACLTPEAIRRQNPKPSTSKSKPSTSKVLMLGI